MPRILRVVAAIAGVIVAAVAAPLLIPLLGATFGAVAAGLLGVVVSAGVSYVAGALGKKRAASPAPSQQSRAQDSKVLIRSSVEPRRVVYGQARVSGPILYAASSGADQQFLHMVIALAGHPVQAVTDIWINDDLITDADFSGASVVAGKYAGKLVIQRYTGSQTTADPILSSESPDGWGASHKLLGVAYLYVRLEFDREKFQGGVPNISALVTGKNDILDPRDLGVRYTRNWALCVLDYLRSPLGLACTDPEIDFGSFIAAANLADEAVPLDAGGTVTQPRYTVDGNFTLDRAPIDVMGEMLDSGGGALVYVAGQYRLQGGAYSTPASSLGPSDFAGPVRLNTRPSRRDLFNAVRGTFIDPGRFWQASEFGAMTNATLEAEDGERIWRDVEMPFVIDHTRAQRLARQMLLRSRESLTFEAPLRYSGLTFAVWDMVAVTLPDFGWTAKPFRIIAWSFSPSEAAVNVTLREEQPSAYAWLYDDGAFGPDAPDTTLVSPLLIPAPTGLTITPTTQQQPDGSLVPALLVEWTFGGHPFVTGFEVQWRVDGTTDWNSMQVGEGARRAVIAPVIIGVAYDIRIRALGSLARSAWSSVADGTGAADTTAPDTPGSPAAAGVIKAISITWTMPAALDLAAVEIWENTSSSAGGRYWVGETRGAGWMRGGLPTNTTRWYWLRSRDLSGNLSAFVGPVSATTSYLLATDLQDAIINTAKFAQGIAPVKIIASSSASVDTGGNAVADGDVAVSVADGRLYRRAAGAWVAVVSAADLVGTLTDAQLQDLDASKLLGTIPGSKFAANSISASKLSVVPASLLLDPTMADAGFWTQGNTEGGNPWYYEANSSFTNSYGVGHGARVLWSGAYAGSGYGSLQSNSTVPVAPGDRFTIGARCANLGNKSVYAEFQFLNAAGGYLGGVSVFFEAGFGSGGAGTKTVQGVAPAGTAQGRFVIAADGSAAYAWSGVAAITDLIVVRPATGEMIVDGEIKAAKIAVNAVTADKIAANAVSADKITANAVTAGKLAANAVTAGTIAAGAVNATEIAAGAVRAEKLAAEEIIVLTLQVKDLIVGTRKFTANSLTDVSSTERSDALGLPFGTWTTVADISFFIADTGGGNAWVYLNTNERGYTITIDGGDGATTFSQFASRVLVDGSWQAAEARFYSMAPGWHTAALQMLDVDGRVSSPVYDRYRWLQAMAVKR